MLVRQSLEHFLAVCEHKNISRAATALNLSQPAIAKSISKLESDLGVRLFERLPRGVMPTIFGKCLIRHAMLVRAELQHAVQEIDSIRGGRCGYVTVGAIPSVVGNFVPKAISKLLTTRPTLHFRVTTGLSHALIRALREGSIDLAVMAVRTGVSDSEIQTIPLFRDTLRVSAREGHPLTHHNPIKLHHLLQYPWVLIGSVSHLYARLDELFIAHDLSPPIPVIETDSFEFAIMHLKNSNSLSLQASQLILRGEASGLVTFDIPEVTWPQTTGVCYRRRGSLSPAAMALIEQLKQN